MQFCKNETDHQTLIRVLDMLVYIKRIQAYNVLMAKLQIMFTPWPDIEIFLVSVLYYQRVLQWIYSIVKSFIYGNFDITISSISPKATKAHTEIFTIFLQCP